MWCKNFQVARTDGIRGISYQWHPKDELSHNPLPTTGQTFIGTCCCANVSKFAEGLPALYIFIIECNLALRFSTAKNLQLQKLGVCACS